jgi:hypothetical protein
MRSRSKFEALLWTLPMLLALGLGGPLSSRLWQALRPLRAVLEGRRR